MKGLTAMLKNWKTTAVGLVIPLVALANMLGIFEVVPHDAEAAVVDFMDAILYILAAVTGLIGLFSRDANISSEESMPADEVAQ